MSLFVWVLLALLLYGAADIVDKGQALNSLTPYPVFGYLLWGVVLLVVWWLLIKPVWDFWRLARHSDLTPKDRAKALHQRITRHIRRHGDDAAILPEEGLKAYAELDEALKRKQWDVLEPLIKACLPYDTLREQARATVLSHSRAAALAVAFSHNSLLDGFCMLIIQMKLVVALARLYGYKPSPVFNTCCFFWVATNSIVTALLNSAMDSVAENALSSMGSQVRDDVAAQGGAGAVDTAAELLSGDAAGDAAADAAADAASGDAFGEALGDLALGGADDAFLLGAEAVGQRIASYTIGLLLEAVIAGSAVYVTGRIFCSKLDGEWRKPTFRALVKLRREGRVEIGKGLMKTAGSLMGRAASAGGAALSSSFKQLRKFLME